MPERIKIGDRFRIQPPKGSAVTHWGKKIFTVRAIQDQVVRGYDSDLPLGKMAVFEADFGKRGKVLHAVPVDWCVKVLAVLAVLVMTSPPILAADGAKNIQAGTLVVPPLVVTAHKTKVRSFQAIMNELLGPQAMPATSGDPALSQVTGNIVTLDGMQLTLRRRDGTIAFVEFLAAAKRAEFPPIGTGKAVTAIGTVDHEGVLHAEILAPTSATQTFWPADR